MHLTDALPTQARWHPEIGNSLVDGAKKALQECGVKPENIIETEVPGSFELPLAARYMALSGKVGVILFRASPFRRACGSPEGGGGYPLAHRACLGRCTTLPPMSRARLAPSPILQSDPHVLPSPSRFCALPPLRIPKLAIPTRPLLAAVPAS